MPVCEPQPPLPSRGQGGIGGEAGAGKEQFVQQKVRPVGQRALQLPAAAEVRFGASFGVGWNVPQPLVPACSPRVFQQWVSSS